MPGSRRHDNRIKVSFNDAERAKVEALAMECGLPVAVYLRRVGLGYRPAPNVDLDAIDKLTRLSAELGKVGGLFKLALTKGQDTSQLIQDFRALRALLESALLDL